MKSINATIKIIVLSDLHLPNVNLNYFRTQVAKEDVQIILFTGDVLDSFDENLFREFLEAFTDLPQPKLIVLGNHVLWQKGKANTQALYEYYLQFPWQKYGFHLLDKEPFVYKGFAFCGNMGWYDYFLRLPQEFDLRIPSVKYIYNF